MRPDLSWLLLALSTFLAVAGIRVGFQLWRVDGDRQRFLACVLFSAGATCMAIESGWSTTNRVALALLSGAFGAMVAAAVLLYRVHRRRGQRREAG